MRYGLAAAGMVVVAIIAIILIVGRSPAPDNPAKRPTAVQLADYANQNSIVSFTTQGRLVGEDQRKAIRISVSPNERRIEILSGYEQFVERSQTYPNTQAAYETFLKALQNAGFARERKSAYSDSRGVCPLGSTYLYELSASGSEKIDLWSTSCRSSEGTFAGNASVVRQLFQLQITDYRQQTRDVRLQSSSSM